MSKPTLLFNPYNHEVIGLILSTRDYYLFKEIKGNRGKKPAHIRRLIQAFKEIFLICPILVNEKFEIIDGQHRYEAAKATGMPIIYYIVKGYGLTEVKVLNSNSSDWKKREFLESQCQLGNKHYMLLNQFWKDFPQFSFMNICQMASNKHNVNNYKESKSNPFEKSFESGSFEFKDPASAYQIARQITDFKEYFEYYNSNRFVPACITIFKSKNYNHLEMIKKLKSCPIRLVKMAEGNQYVNLLEEIFNWRRNPKVSLKYNG